MSCLDAETIAKRLDRPIVVVGLMGAGKSCVGRRLATRLGWDFVDSDHEFESSAGCSISDFFAREGEASFRAAERRIIDRLMARGHMVLATGGGAFCDPDTRQRILSSSVSVWIRADLDLLVKRTSGRDHRPLLKQGDPKEILSRLMDSRYPIYAQARITVDTTDEPPDITVTKVVEELSHLLETQA